MGVPPPFLVTGAGRCGTHFLCTALNRLGVPTGHEEVFAYDESAAGQWGDRRGDCSWPGAVYPHRLPVGAPVLHLVRDPLATVRSRLGDNNLGAASSQRVVARFVARHRPDVFADAVDDTGRALLFVARWNRLVETIPTAFAYHPYRRVRIEELSTDTELLADTVAFLTGERTDRGAVAGVLGELDDSLGSRGRRGVLEWSGVEDHPNGAELLAVARDYGYRS